MKKLIYLIIAIMFVSAMPEVTFAQSNDPFEQQTLKTNGNSTRREKKVKRRQAPAQEAPATPATPATPAAPAAPAARPAAPGELIISNPCDEWLDFELVSVIGSMGTQMVTITGKFTNHGLNKTIEVGHQFLAYDNDGVEHVGWRYSCACRFNSMTDVPVKFTIEIPEKIDPKKTQVIPVVSFDIDKCRIEMKNVPINWK